MNELAICWKRSEIVAMVREEVGLLLSHPEPKEKPKCWCEGRSLSALPAGWKYCSECGRRLDRKESG